MYSAIDIPSDPINQYYVRPIEDIHGQDLHFLEATRTVLRDMLSSDIQ